MAATIDSNSANMDSNSANRDSNSSEILHQFDSIVKFFRVYKDGRVEKFHTDVKIPPFDDPTTGVKSRDFVISPDVSARLFLPKTDGPDQKLRILLYIHGGGFCLGSAFSLVYHTHLATLAHESNSLAVSVEYRHAPEHLIPACYDDTWAAIQWIASHHNGTGPDPWLNQHGDFNRVVIGGDSCGGNMTHNLAVRVGKLGLPGVKLDGIVLVHAYFGGDGDEVDRMLLFMCGGDSELEDRMVRPKAEDLAAIGCDRVLMFIAEKDEFGLKERGERYCEELKKSGWKGTVETVVHRGENHCFHLMDGAGSPNAVDLINRFASFIKRE